MDEIKADEHGDDSDRRYLMGVYETIRDGSPEDLRNLSEELREKLGVSEYRKGRIGWSMAWSIDPEDPDSPLLLECTHQWLTRAEVRQLRQVCENALRAER